MICINCTLRLNAVLSDHLNLTYKSNIILRVIASSFHKEKRSYEMCDQFKVLVKTSEKTEGVTKNEQSGDTCHIGHKTQKKDPPKKADRHTYNTENEIDEQRGFHQNNQG